jgi:hypothetical protein
MRTYADVCSGPRPQARELASKAQTIESLRDALAAGELSLVELRRELAADAEAASSRDESAAQRGEALFFCDDFFFVTFFCGESAAQRGEALFFLLRGKENM